MIRSGIPELDSVVPGQESDFKLFSQAENVRITDFAETGPLVQANDLKIKQNRVLTHVSYYI